MGYWRLVTPEKERFGHRLWIDIVVTHQEAGADKLEPVALEVSPDVPPSPFEAQLGELATMGFSDRTQNISLLEAANGDLTQVIDQLLG